MTDQTKQTLVSSSQQPVHAIPKYWHQILDEASISKAVSRICYEILEREKTSAKLAIVGVRTAGEYLARRIHKRIQEIEATDVSFGVVDITLYRDDLATNNAPILKGTEISFPIANARIVLVDDVLFTGRTIRAALDAITDFGRPRTVELACLIDRGHRELPIRADYVGKNVPSSREDSVKVKLKEMGYAEDGVYIVSKDRGAV
jgi:pyrimidine operon attenuation protein/uracil phosphoribosyltransferase